MLVAPPTHRPPAGARARRDGLLDERRAAARRRPALRAQAHHAARCGRRCRRSQHRVDLETLRAASTTPSALALNDIGRVTLRTSSPLVADPYAAQPRHRRVHPDRRGHQRHRRRGHDRRGARGRAGARAPRATSPGTRRRWTATTAGARSASRAPRSGSPACPASGKSTIAVALERAARRTRAARPTCSTATTCATACPTTSASPPGDRAENIRRIGAGRAAAGRRRHGRARRRWSRPTRPTAADRAERHTRPRACRSSRSTSTRRWRSASGATPRASTRAHAPASSTGLTGVDAPYEAPARPRTSCSTRRRRPSRVGRRAARRCSRARHRLGRVRRSHRPLMRAA